MLRRFEDKDDRVNRRLLLTLSEAAPSTDEMIDKLEQLGMFPALKGWSTDAAGRVRRLQLGIRLPSVGGEARLVAALRAEPGVSGMQLEPPA